jgi:8-oxo-dGTP pyrophosphatase MutT (NUDIX family)
MIAPAPRGLWGRVGCGGMARARRYDEVSAGGVVVRRGVAGWEVCLIRVGNAWSLPKGMVDRGETPEQAALREIGEEVGLPVEKLSIRGELPASEYMYRRDGRLLSKVVFHYLVEAPPGAPVHPDAWEVDEAAWVPLATAARQVSYSDLRAALDEAVRRLEPSAGS